SRLQSDVQNLCRRDGRRVGSDLSPPGNGSGYLRSIPKYLGGLPEKAPLRNRPNRQSIPKRNQSTQFPLSVPRVRADGTRILLPARKRPGAAGVLAAGTAPFSSRHRAPLGVSSCP